MKKIRFIKWLAALLVLLAFTACTTSETSRSTGTYVDDKVITAKVKTALASSEETKARQINIETYRGVVQLNGFVNTEEEKERAEEIAEEVEGVVRVENNLSIRTEIR